MTRGLRRRHRLYWRIWLAVLASLALVALITASVVHLLGELLIVEGVEIELAFRLVRPRCAPAAFRSESST